MAFALRPLELRDTPVEYLEALCRLRAMRQVHAPFVRPTRMSAGGTSNANAYGIFSKVPPEERLVAEELDCWAHARAARELFFPERLPACPEPSWDRSSCRPSTESSIWDPISSVLGGHSPPSGKPSLRASNQYQPY